MQKITEYHWNIENMERLSILIDNRHLDLQEVVFNTEKAPEFLCENFGVILSSKQSLKCHMVLKYSEKVTTYQCSKCPTTCNRLDNIRRHIRKHPDQTNTPKTVMYEIKQMSPEPEPMTNFQNKNMLNYKTILWWTNQYQWLHLSADLEARTHPYHGD